MLGFASNLRQFIWQIILHIPFRPRSNTANLGPVTVPNGYLYYMIVNLDYVF